ncbi:HNH endonuclease [Candidatus Woesearchaeota archaeon]|nr:HNH endonuclease [Candidatus Woesearchaeota archaeon]
MDDKLREMIWQREDGICQKCKKKLFNIIDPYEDTINCLLSMEEIPIFKWTKKCWKCRNETEVVTYDFYAAYNHHIGDIEKLDKILMEKFPFVKKIFSKTMESEVIANTCINCGALQGNWFIMEDLMYMKSSNVDMDKLIEISLPNNLRFEDLRIEKEALEPEREKIPFIAHVHHIDNNKSNNDPNNLMLLCRNCNIKIHSNLRN